MQLTLFIGGPKDGQRVYLTKQQISVGRWECIGAMLPDGNWQKEYYIFKKLQEDGQIFMVAVHETPQKQSVMLQLIDGYHLP